MKTANELLESLGIKNSITLIVNGVELTFNRDDSAFDQFTNEVDKNNRLTPIKDYLLATISKEHKDTLLKIINVPSVALSLVEKVQEAFLPSLEITVKN